MTNLSGRMVIALGLHCNRSFHRDSVFLLLLALGPATWVLMAGLAKFQPRPWHSVLSLAFVSFALWQPVVEELLFRGVVQGHMLRAEWGQKTWNYLTFANLATSVVFSLSHLASHSLLWSLLVFAPSLCFGVARDRFRSVYPSMLLHGFYNAGYFFLFGNAALHRSL